MKTPRALLAALLLAAPLFAAPPPPALVDVPAPDLAGLEPEVAAQLTAVGKRLAAARRGGATDPQLHGEAGETYHAYDLTAAAEACYRNAAALAPGDFRWSYLLGVVLEKEGRLEEAAAALQASLGGDDLYYPGLLRLAGVDLALGRTEDAAALLDVARGHAPEDPALLGALGELALARGRHAEAIGLLEEALRRQPAASRLHYPLAMALRNAGRPAEAREHLARAGAVGILPRDPVLAEVEARRRGGRTWLLEGRKAFAAGDAAGAAAAFRHAVAADPTSVPALVDLAAAEARLGDIEPARLHLEHAVELDPGNSDAHFNLGLLLAHQGRAADAEPHLRAAVARASGDAAARLELALALGTLGRLPEALDQLEKTEPIDPARCPDLLKLLAAARAASQPLAGKAAALAKRLPCGPP